MLALPKGHSPAHFEEGPLSLTPAWLQAEGLKPLLVRWVHREAETPSQLEKGWKGTIIAQLHHDIMVCDGRAAASLAHPRAAEEVPVWSWERTHFN